MDFFEKRIVKVNFNGITYKEIRNTNDYIMLEDEVRKLLEKGDKTQFLIDAENLKNESVEEKERNLSINLPLAMSLLFGTTSLILGIIFGGVDKFIAIIFGNIICVVVNLGLVVYFVGRTDNILKLYTRKIVFYDTICRIISGTSDI